MKEIKEVKYDDIECFCNNDAVCPYCGYSNYIEAEDYKGQDEETIEECGSCERKFVHTIDYKVTFTSIPYENWLIAKIGSSNRHIKYYKECIIRASHEELEYLSNMLEYYENELVQLFKEVEKLEDKPQLDDDEERDEK